MKLVGGGSDINRATPSSFGECAFYLDFPKEFFMQGQKCSQSNYMQRNVKIHFEKAEYLTTKRDNPFHNRPSTA